MIQKGTYLFSVDKNGILFLGVFHLYFGFFKKNSKYGDFLKVSVKKTTSSFIVLKKSKFKSILVLTCFFQKKKDATYLKFKSNSCVVLKRRLTSLGREVVGPVNYNLFRKRFVFSFIYVL